MWQTQSFDNFLNSWRFSEVNLHEDGSYPIDLDCPNCPSRLRSLDGYPFCSKCDWDSIDDSDWWSGTDY